MLHQITLPPNVATSFIETLEANELLKPGLVDGDCEAIDQDILQLQKELHQQVTEKGKGLMKLIPAVEEGKEIEQRALEQVAMEKLVELAYKKKLATRGSSAARNGLTKVAKLVALAFMKRTLARCRKFVEIGRSYFLEPVFKDVLYKNVLFQGPNFINFTINRCTHYASISNREMISRS